MSRCLSYRIKLFLSYLVVIILFICAYSAITYRQYRIHDREKALTGYANDINRISDRLSMRLVELQRTAVGILSNTHINLDALEGGGAAALTALSELAKYRYGNANIDNIYLCRSDWGRLYSMDGMVERDVLVEQKFRLGQVEAVRFRGLAHGRLIHQLLFFSDGNKLLYQYVPGVRTRLGGSRILFELSSSTLSAILDVNLLEDGGSVAVWDEAMILNAGPAGERALARAYDAAGRREAGIAWQGERYSVLFRIAENGYAYIGLVPEPLLMTDSGRGQTLSVALLGIAMLLVMSVVAAMLTGMYYRPLRKLSRMVGMDEPRNDEFDWITRAVQRERDRTETLLRYVEEQNDILCESILSTLITGQNTERQVEEKQDQLSALTKAREFAVVYYKGICTHALVRKRDLLDGRVSVYPLGLDEVDSLAMVLAFSQRGLPLQEAVTELMDAYNTLAPRATGVSEVVREGKALMDAYLEAYIAMRFSERTPVYYAQLPDAKYETLQENEVEGIVHAMSYCGEEELLRRLDVLLGRLTHQETSGAMLNFRMKQLLMHMLTSAKRHPAMGAEPLEAADVTAAIVKSISARTAAQFAPSIKQLARLLQRCIRERENTNRESLKQHILHYLDQNLGDDALSLETLSSQFGHTIYYWSRFFREQVGIGFKDYLWGLRVKRAKDLLARTDEPQQRIIREIGYQEVTSFCRKFRASEGLTPGQYRKIYRTGPALGGEEKADG